VENGVVTDLGTLGAPSSSAHAINDSGRSVRAGDFADRVSYYRHDLNFGLAGVPADPHTYITAQQQPANYARVAIGAQNQIATLFATDGAMVIHPTPAALWEAPIISPLLEDLFFLPR
jgi:uncharacterized membrane protein